MLEDLFNLTRTTVGVQRLQRVPGPFQPLVGPVATSDPSFQTQRFLQQILAVIGRLNPAPSAMRSVPVSDLSGALRFDQTSAPQMQTLSKPFFRVYRLVGED